MLALHGYNDPDHQGWEQDIILKRADYNKHYIDGQAPLFQWWREMLLAAPCIFIGTSLHEPGLQRVIEHLMKIDLAQIRSIGHLHLVAKPDNDPDGIESLPRTSMEVAERLYYHPCDEHHSGLLEVLHQFSKVPINRPSPRMEAPKPIGVAEKFSFAR